MSKKFLSEKGLVTGLIFSSIIVVLTFLLAFSYIQTRQTPLVFIPVLAPLLFFLWLWFYTYYRIDEHFIYYRSGPFFGKIDITKINKVEVNKTMWVGFKPALAFNGMIVKYNKWDEIYFSPKDKQLFLEELLKVNPSIIIRQAGK
jgi:hypothetical protein